MRSSPRPSPPGRPKDPEKRAAILEAAIRLFPARGYDGVSMDAIAQAAGVSKLTVYSHFEDKEALFAAAVTCCCEQILPHQVFEPEAGQTVRDSLVAIGRGFLDLVMDERSVTLHRVLIGQAPQDHHLAEVFFAAGPQRTLEEMASFLRQAHLTGALHVPEPNRAAEHFFCLLKGVCHMRILIGLCEVPGAREREAHVAEVVELFLRAHAPAAARSAA